MAVEDFYLKENQSIDRSQIQNAIGMHIFDQVNWKDWFYYIEELWANYNLTAHTANVNGLHYGDSTHSKTYKGIKKKVEKFNFEGIASMNIGILNSDGLETKNVDQVIANTYVSSDQEPFENTISFTIDKDVLPFDLEKYLDIAGKFHDYTGAKYGYFFSWPMNGAPGIYVMGSDNASITQKEIDRTQKWDKACDPLRHGGKGETLINYIRDIYRINFLSREHLNLKIDSNGTTLEQWIRAGGKSFFRGLPKRGILDELRPGFYYWYIENESYIPKIRKELTPSGIIICTHG